MMYHATKDERGVLRDKLDKLQNKRLNNRRRKTTENEKGKDTQEKKATTREEEDVLPVLITSYDISINDRKYLQRYKVPAPIIVGYKYSFLTFHVYL